MKHYIIDFILNKLGIIQQDAMCETCVNRHCISNDSICNYCEHNSKYEYDTDIEKNGI
jgi:hypothetical protein